MRNHADADWRELFGNDCRANLTVARDLWTQLGPEFSDDVTVAGIARLKERGAALA